MQIMVATAGTDDADLHRSSGQHPVSPLHPAAAHARCGLRGTHQPQVARAARTPTRRPRRVGGGTLTVHPYMMRPEYGGLVTPPHFTFALAELTRDAATPVYRLGAEEAFMVLDGVLDVEMVAGDARATQRLGPRDLAVVPAGVERRLVNSDAATVRFLRRSSVTGGRPGDGWHERERRHQRRRIASDVNVTHLRHLALAVPDFERSHAFFTAAWGLRDAGTANGAAYLRTGRNEAFQLALVAGSERRIERIAFGLNARAVDAARATSNVPAFRS